MYEDWYLLLEKAREAEQQDAWLTAEACLTRALALCPPDAAGPVRISLVRVIIWGEIRDRYEEARGMMRREIESNPQDPYLYAILGRLLWEIEDYAEAERAYNQEIELSPAPCATSYFFLGDAQWQLGRFEEAERTLREAIRIDPTYEEAMAFLAYVIQGDHPEEAEALYRRAIALDPEAEENARRGLGFLLLRDDQHYEESETLLREALAIGSDDDHWTHLYLAICKWEQGDLEEAERQLLAAQRCEPKFVLAVAWLGKFYLRTGRLEEGQRELDRALQMDPDDSWCIAYLAEKWRRGD